MKTEQKPYLHGGNVDRAFSQLKIPPRLVTDFSVNVNPLGPPEKILDAWPALSAEICRYPTPDGEGVKAFYHERFGIQEESVLPGNGAIELIYLAPRALKIRRGVILQPCFHDYAQALRLCGAKIVSVTLTAEDLFRIPESGQRETCLTGVDAVFMGNPNNPTGTLMPREDLLDIARRHPSTMFLVDESFVQFLDDPSSVSLLDQRFFRPNLLVFHSLTKFYCLPGLRLGALIGHPETISRLRPFKEPWTVNAVAEKVCSILARCRGYEQQTLDLVRKERRTMLSDLAGVPGIKIFPATANFFLAQWTATGDLDDLLRPMLLQGLHVRDCRNFPGLEDNYFRFAVRTPHENECLVHALREICGSACG